LSYRPARLHRIAESIPWNRFLGSINISKYGLCTASFAAPWSHGKDDIYVILVYGGVVYYCNLKIKIKTRKEEHNEDFQAEIGVKIFMKEKRKNEQI
jgi:hypothetical protein